MENNIRALIVIIALSSTVFYIAKPICLGFMTEANLIRRRNVWLILTVTAFVSPSFWIYAIVALSLSYWAAKNDSNPVAVFVILLHVIPPFNIELPAIIVNKLVEVNNYRLLSVSILIPIAWNEYFKRDKKKSKLKAIDFLFVLYWLMQLALIAPHEDLTNTIRRALTTGLDTLLVYYVISRVSQREDDFRELMAVFVLMMALMVPVAIFESAKHWLLYAGLSQVWEVPEMAAYLLRGNSLRSQASAGHSLTLGYLFAIAFGFWLCISEKMGKTRKYIGGAFIAIGLISTLSRAPWLVAILLGFCYLFLKPQGVRRIMKLSLMIAPVAVGVLFSPVGEKIIDHLPFIGTVDESNVDYRVRLAEAAIERITENPIFGDPFYMSHLEDLRQGQGIIDPVNTYAAIAMLFGLVGLTIYVLPLILAIFLTNKTIRTHDQKFDELGASILVCLVGTFFFLATCSLIGAIPLMFYFLIGLAVAYVKLDLSKST